MTSRYPGGQGEPGKPGEPGEGGRGGAGGQGGEGVPPGPGGRGGEGGRGAQGERGEAGAQGPTGPQPKLRWAPAIGYIILALVLGFLIFRIQTTCVDTRGDQALRHQWARIAAIISAQEKGVVTPAIEEISLAYKDAGYQPIIPPVKVGEKMRPRLPAQMFGASYRLALDEAGPAPDCRGLFP